MIENVVIFTSSNDYWAWYAKRLEGRHKRFPALTELRQLLELADEGSGLRWRVDRGGRNLAGKLAGSIGTDGKGRRYWRVGINRRVCNAHRIVYALWKGWLPSPDLMVDHKDGNGLNNSTSNLRLATNAENQRNRQGACRDSKSGVRGVYEHKQAKKWQAMIQKDGVLKGIGLFSTKAEATAARIAAGDQLHGEFAGNLVRTNLS